MTNEKGRIRIHKTLRDRRGGTFPIDILSRLSISDQNANIIAREDRISLSLNAEAEHDVQFGGSLFSYPLAGLWNRDKTEEMGVRRVGNKSPLGRGVWLREQSWLKRGKCVGKANAAKTTHMEWVNFIGLAVASPLTSLFHKILR